MQGHSLIGVATENAFTRKLLPMLSALGDGAYALRSDSDLVRLAAIRAGFGIGICKVWLASRDPSMVRVLRDLLNIPLETWLAMHENLRANPACAAAFAALAEGLIAYANGQDIKELN